MGSATETSTALEDDRLVGAVRAGNEEAFSRMYDRHCGELLAYCRHILGSRDDAEDALQQTFMKAYRALQKSEKRIVIRPWLYAIARNECISMIRRRRETVSDPGLLERSRGSLNTEVEDREELRAMLDDLSRLPDEQRQALLLSGLETMSGDQIAEVLDTDRDRVKALVFRARRSLSQSREAREVSCAEIREQLTVLRGGSLRRKVLREHLLVCEGCTEYRAEIRRGRELEAHERARVAVVA